MVKMSLRKAPHVDGELEPHISLSCFMCQCTTDDDDLKFVDVPLDKAVLKELIILYR